jgi:hypothetical protein
MLFRIAPTRKADAISRNAILNSITNRAATASSSEYSSGLSCDSHLIKMKNRPNNNSRIPRQGRIPRFIRKVIRLEFCEFSITTPIQK